MVHFQLDELPTLIVGILALFLGGVVRHTVPFLRRIDMPNAVIGAMLVALLVLLGQLYMGVDVTFGSRMRDAMLLVFFTSIGLSAKLSALLMGGKPLLILCGVTVFALIAQNVSGSAFALAWGAHPAYGVLAGSLSFVGGPGTAMAWAKELEALGLRNAQVVGVGAATLAVVTGALVAGPVTGWIVRRHKLRSDEALAPDVTFAGPSLTKSEREPAFSHIESLLASLLVIAVSVFLGEKLNGFVKDTGLLLPGFLSAMIAGVLITNLADIFKYRLDLVPIEAGSALALQLFLVTALMATPLISVAAIIVPLAINVAIQVAVTVSIAYFLLFRLLGRDYDAAVTAGGFLGFGLSSMPVAMATMDEIGSRYGPSPKASC
jgi:ESS family glutamate:Na+ symporter